MSSTHVNGLNWWVFSNKKSKIRILRGNTRNVGNITAEFRKSDRACLPFAVVVLCLESQFHPAPALALFLHIVAVCILAKILSQGRFQMEQSVSDITVSSGLSPFMRVE